MTEGNMIADFSLSRIEQILPANSVSEINPSLITLESDIHSKNGIENNQVDRSTLKSISPKSDVTSLSDRNKTSKIFPIFALSNSSSIANQTQEHDLLTQGNFLPECNNRDILDNQSKIPSSCSSELHSVSSVTPNNVQEIQKADLVSDCFSSRRRKRGRKCVKTHNQVTDNHISDNHITIEKQSTKKILLSHKAFNDSKNVTSNNDVSKCIYECVTNSVSDVKSSKIISPQDTNTSVVETQLKLFPVFSKISPKQDFRQKVDPVEVETVLSSITKENISQDSITNKRRKCKVKIPKSILTGDLSVISKKSRKRKLRNVTGSKNTKCKSKKTVLSVKIISKKHRRINKNKSVVCSELEDISTKSTPEKNVKQITEDNVFGENNTLKALPLAKKRRGRKCREKNNSGISKDIDNEKSSAINKSTSKMDSSVKCGIKCKTNNSKHPHNNVDAATSVKSNSICSSQAQKLFSIFSNSSLENKVKETKMEENSLNEHTLRKSLIKNVQNNSDFMLAGKKHDKFLKEAISSDSPKINFMKGNTLLTETDKNFPKCNMPDKIFSEINEQKLNSNLSENVSSIESSHSIPMKGRNKTFKNSSTKKNRRKKIINKHKQVDNSLVEDEIAIDNSKMNSEILQATQSKDAHEVKDKIAEISFIVRKHNDEKSDASENFHDENRELSKNGNKFCSKTVIDTTGIKIKDGISFQTDCINANSFQTKKSDMELPENDENLNNASTNKPLLFPLFSKCFQGREENQDNNLTRRELSSDNIVLEKTKTEEKQKKLVTKQSHILKENFQEKGVSLDNDTNLKTEKIPTKNDNKGHVQETVSCKKVQLEKIQEETVSPDILSNVREKIQNKRLQKINACKDPAGISANNILKTKRTAKNKHLLNVGNSSNDSVNGNFFEITSQNSPIKAEQFYKGGNAFQRNNANNIPVAVKRKQTRKSRKGKHQKSYNEIFEIILDGENQTISNDELCGDTTDATELKTKCKINDEKFMNADSKTNDSVTTLPKNMVSSNTDSRKPLKLFPLFAKAFPNKYVKQGDNLLMKKAPNSDCEIIDDMLEKLESTSSSKNVSVKEKQKIKISKNTNSNEILDIVPEAVESKRNRKTTKCKGNANVSEKNILTSKRVTRKRQVINIDGSGDEEYISQNSTNGNCSTNIYDTQNTVVIHNNKDSTDEEIQEIIIGNVCRDDKTESQQTEKIQNVFKNVYTEKISGDRCRVKKLLLTEEENFIPFPSFTHCSFSYQELNPGIFCSTSSEILYEDIRKPYWNNIVGLTDVRSINDEIKKENPEICSTSVLNKRLNDNVSEKKVYGRTQDEMLWTDYLNDLKEDFNKSALDEIRTWLLQWKSKFKKPFVDESSIDGFSSDSSDSTDGVSNSIIIAGMPGTGKTSIVLSLANELGFKVLEVNSSTCRNGRSISNQLKEALESYHVENVRTENANSETALTDNILISFSCSIQETSCESKLEDVFNEEKSSKRKVSVSSRNLIKSKKVCLPNKGQKISPQKEPGRNIKTFFKSVNKDDKYNSSSFKVMQQNLDKDESETHKTSSKKRKVVKEFSYDKSSELNHTEREGRQEVSSCKISSLTIILFDDIDVVFEEDEGLWNTIKGFLKISRKPVIFTVSRNLAYVKANLGEDIRVLTLKPALQDTAVEKVKYQCVKHNRGNAAIDLQLLTSHNANDLRRCLLDAQFWTQARETSWNQGSRSCMLNTSEVALYKTVHANSFFLGSLNFLACDLKQLLLNNTPSHSVSVISEYHKMGYDVLHSNIFSMMNILDSLKTEVLWQNIQNCSDKVNSVSESNMWDEACKLFELKKAAFLKGSSSKDLFAFSSLLEDFSFTDSLKGQFYSNFHWLSVPERVKKWTDGLPMCSENNFPFYGDILADIIALINIYKIREMCSNCPEIYHAPTEKSFQLFLDHPLLKCDYILNNKTEQQLQCISTALPSFHLLSKTNLNMDYLSTLKIMCQSEYSKQISNCKRSRRFLHYFDSISLALDKFHTEFILES